MTSHEQHGGDEVEPPTHYHCPSCGSVRRDVSGFDNGFTCPDGWHKNDTEWQPIETAPQTGENILVSDGKYVHEAWYTCGEWCVPNTRRDWWIGVRFWMSLPSPPKEDPFLSWLRSYTQSDGRGYALPIVRAAFEAGVATGKREEGS